MKQIPARYSIKLVRETSSDYTAVKSISGAADVADIARNVLHIEEETCEIVVVFYLDAKNYVIGHQEVSRGSLTGSVVHPREIYKGALLANAHSIIMMHNHPSGVCEPSPADKQITTAIKKAGELLQVELLDHVIIGDKEKGDFYSFKDHWLI